MYEHICRFNSIEQKKERVMYECEVDLRNFFIWRFNLSNDDVNS